MSLIVIGASGYIGARLLAAAPPKSWGTASKPGRPNLAPFELANPKNFPWHRLRAGDVVVITAAISSPDICAQEPERAVAVNITGTSDLIQGCLERGARVLFFSSDTVFGASEETFDEAAPCRPVGDYGRMKRNIEERFAGEPGFCALRLSYVFSLEDKFMRYLAHCAYNGIEAEIFHPFLRNVIHRDDVVAVVLKLAEGDRFADSPFVNLGGPALVSRFDMAMGFKKLIAPALKIKVIKPPPSFFIQRPPVINMHSPKIAHILGRQPLSFSDALTAEHVAPIKEIL